MLSLILISVVIVFIFWWQQNRWRFVPWQQEAGVRYYLKIYSISSEYTSEYIKYVYLRDAMKTICGLTLIDHYILIKHNEFFYDWDSFKAANKFCLFFWPNYFNKHKLNCTKTIP